MIVSVVITTFNHSNYIAECLESVLMQKTDFDFEIILGEDESTDGTREICEKFAYNYPDKIKLFLRSRTDVIYINGKPTGRFNFIETLKAAKGKYVAILEGDDYWTDPLKLQKQVDFLEANEDCVACHHWQKLAVLESGEWIEKTAPKSGHGYLSQSKATVKEIFENKMRVKTRTLVFRNILNDFPTEYYKLQFGDVPLSMMLGKYGDFGFIDEEMAVYRLTGLGVSNTYKNSKDRVYNHFKIWIKVWDFGNSFHDGKFSVETSETIGYFLKHILLNNRFNKTLYLGLMNSLLSLNLLTSFKLRLIIYLHFEMLKRCLMALKNKIKK